MKILIIAFSCKPDTTSEPGLGWSFVEELAKDHQVTLATHPGNAEAVKRFQAKNAALRGVDIIAVQQPSGHHRSVWGGLAYVIWQYRTLKKLKKVCHQWQVAHHVTFVNSWMPALFGLLPITTFLNAGQRAYIPLRFYRFQSFKGNLHSLVRTCAVLSLGIINDAFFLKRYSRLLVTNPPDFSRTAKPVNVPVNTLPAERIDSLMTEVTGSRKSDHDSFELISVGRVVPFKGIALSLHAVAQLRARIPTLTFTIIGDGEEMDHLKSISKKLGIEAHVTFLGSLPLDKTWSRVKQADVFLQPSFCDTEGTSMIEAMFAGLPVVTLDWKGNKPLFPQSIFPMAAVKTPRETINGLSELIYKLYENPDYRAQVGRQLREHALETRSRTKAIQRIAELYQEVLEEEGRKQ